MKKAIATLKTEIGIMTIYYNGINEEMTAEIGDTIEEIGYKAKNITDAKKSVKSMYRLNAWELKIIK